MDVPKFEVVGELDRLIDDTAFRDIIASSSSYNERLVSERRSRLPFIDSQTGVAQSDCHLWMKRSDRLRPVSNKYGQVYLYPSRRWRKRKRQYLTDESYLMRSTRFASPILFQQFSGQSSGNNSNDPMTNHNVPSSSQTSSSFHNHNHHHLSAMNYKLSLSGSQQSLSSASNSNDTMHPSDSQHGRTPNTHNDGNTNASPSIGNPQLTALLNLNESSSGVQRDFSRHSFANKLHAASAHDNFMGMHDSELPIASANGFQDSTPPKHPAYPHWFAGSNEHSKDGTSSTAHDHYYLEQTDIHTESDENSDLDTKVHATSTPVTARKPRVRHRRKRADQIDTASGQTAKKYRERNNNLKIADKSTNGVKKPYKCQFCGLSYKTRAGLTHHMNRSHLGNKSINKSQPNGGHAANVVSNQSLNVVEDNSTGQNSNSSITNESRGDSPSPYCDFCLGDTTANKRTGKAEELISCADCGRSGHPTCLNFNQNMIESVKKYRWQCLECKSCGLCGTSDNDEQLLFCDDCDRGYHMYCLIPPLSKEPEGSWSCDLCLEEYHGQKACQDSAATQSQAK